MHGALKGAKNRPPITPPLLLEADAGEKLLDDLETTHCIKPRSHSRAGSSIASSRSMTPAMAGQAKNGRHGGLGISLRIAGTSSDAGWFQQEKRDNHFEGAPDFETRPFDVGREKVETERIQESDTLRRARWQNHGLAWFRFESCGIAGQAKPNVGPSISQVQGTLVCGGFMGAHCPPVNCNL